MSQTFRFWSLQSLSGEFRYPFLLYTLTTAPTSAMQQERERTKVNSSSFRPLEEDFLSPFMLQTLLLLLLLPPQHQTAPEKLGSRSGGFHSNSNSPPVWGIICILIFSCLFPFYTSVSVKCQIHSTQILFLVLFFSHTWWWSALPALQSGIIPSGALGALCGSRTSTYHCTPCSPHSLPQPQVLLHWEEPGCAYS